MDKDFSFASERLRFRGITADDAGKIVEWRGRPENYRNFLDARPITLEEHRRWFEGYLGDPSRYDFMIMGEDGSLVGTVGLSNITEEGCEISYMIGEESCRGKGYAKEAVRALTAIAFEELGVRHVDARIRPHNEASMHVAADVGFCEYERMYRADSPYGG